MCEFDPVRQKLRVKFRKVLPGLDKTETFSTHRLTMGLPARMTIHCRFSTYRDVVRATGKVPGLSIVYRLDTQRRSQIFLTREEALSWAAIFCEEIPWR
jgi:hypothetical protein